MLSSFANDLFIILRVLFLILAVFVCTKRNNAITTVTINTSIITTIAYCNSIALPERVLETISKSDKCKPSRNPTAQTMLCHLSKNQCPDSSKTLPWSSAINVRSATVSVAMPMKTHLYFIKIRFITISVFFAFCCACNIIWCSSFLIRSDSLRLCFSTSSRAMALLAVNSASAATFREFSVSSLSLWFSCSIRLTLSALVVNNAICSSAFTIWDSNFWFSDCISEFCDCSNSIV